MSKRLTVQVTTAEYNAQLSHSQIPEYRTSLILEKYYVLQLSADKAKSKLKGRRRRRGRRSGQYFLRFAKKPLGTFNCCETDRDFNSAIMIINIILRATFTRIPNNPLRLLFMSLFKNFGHEYSSSSSSSYL